MSVVSPSSAAPVGEGLPAVRRLTPADLTIALRQGFDDFTQKRGEILLLALIYPLVGLLACTAAFGGDVAALAFPLAAGLSLMGPAVAAGFYRIACLREAGENATWSHFLDVWRGRSATSLLLLTLGLFVLFMAWLAVAWGIYGATLGREPYAGFGDFLRRLLTTPQGWAMVVVGNAAGLVFAAAALAASAVSFPMVVDRDVDPMTAVRTSLKAVSENPAVFARWGATVGVLLVLGSIPLFVGLAIVLPVLGYATWHLYTRAVVRPGAAA